MNRHDRRSLDAIHNKFLSSLPKNNDSPHVRETKQRFFAWLEQLKAEGKTVPRFNGVLSEERGSDTWIEEVIRPEEGGCHLKLWGISYPFKMHSNMVMQLHNIELAKSLFSANLRDMVRDLPLGMAGIIFHALFTPKRFLRFIDSRFENIINFSVRWNWIDDYNSVARELQRASFEVLRRDFGYAPDWHIDLHSAKHYFPGPDGTMASILFKVAVFICFFLEVDTAYRFRIQDAFGERNGSSMTRLWEGLEILLSREAASGIGYKWKFIKQGLRFALWRYPELERFLGALMDEIDWGKVKMDEADWYYSLGYVSYNFGGKTKDERWAERQRIDKEKQHVIFFA